MPDSLLPTIIAASLIGGVGALIGGLFLLWQENLARRISLHLVTVASGTLLGVAFLDLLPEALHEASELGQDPEGLLVYTLAGMIVFFIVELLLLKLHTHEEERSLEGHDYRHEHYTTHSRRHAVPALVSVGDAIHNFIDGIAIAAAFLVNPATGWLTTFAVAAHEIPQEVSDFSVLLHAGWEKRKVLLWNLAIALSSTLGAIIAYSFRGAIEPVLAPLIAFTAGIFIYIAASDLFPDIQHHAKRDKPWHVLVSLALGVAVVWLLARFLGHQ